MDKFKYENSEGIVYNSVKNPQMLLKSGPIGVLNRISVNGDEVTNIDLTKPVVNAVDIDWNGAEVGYDKLLNTTTDLLNWIKELKTSNSNQIEETITEQFDDVWFSFTISAFRWYEDGVTPRTPINNVNNIYNPFPGDNSYITGVPAGSWSSTVPDRPIDSSPFVLWCSYATVRLYVKDSNKRVLGWSTPVRISGVNGTPGEDAKSREWIYKCFAEEQINLQAPNNEYDTPSFLRDDYIPDGWLDNPEGVSPQNKYEYTCYRDFKDNKWGYFSEPILWSTWGRVGIDGDGVEYVFISTDKHVTPPTFIDADDADVDTYGRKWYDDEFLPKVRIENEDETVTIHECTDDPVELESKRYTWVGKRNKGLPNSEGLRQWTKYSGTMSLWSKIGSDITIKDGTIYIDGVDTGITIDSGSTGTSITEEGCVNGEPDVSNPSEGMVVIACGKLWYYDGNDWIVIGESNGSGNYLHIAYAKDVQFNDGNVTRVTNFTVNPNKAEKYDWIGICVDNNVNDPGATYDNYATLNYNTHPEIRAYKWNRIGGYDGNGIEWVYIRTKINTKPTVDNLPYEGEGGDPTKDEFLPKVGNLSDFDYIDSSNRGNIEYDTWQDDSGDATPEWSYRWRVSRKFLDGEWKEFGNVTTDGSYTTSGFKLTTDNDTIIIDDNTNNVGLQHVSKTNLYLWDETENIINNTERFNTVNVIITHSNTTDYNDIIKPAYISGGTILPIQWGQSINILGMSNFQGFCLIKTTDVNFEIGTDSISYNLSASGNSTNISTSIVQSFLVVNINDGTSYNLLVIPNTLPVSRTSSNSDYSYSNESTINISATASSSEGVVPQSLYSKNNANIGNLYIEIEPTVTINSNGQQNISVDLPPSIGNNKIVDDIKYFNINLYYKTGQNTGVLVDSETIDFSIKGDKGDRGEDGTGLQGLQGPAGEPLKYYLVCSPSIINFNPNAVGDNIGNRTINIKYIKTDPTDSTTLYVYRKLLGNTLSSNYVEVLNINDNLFNTVIGYDGTNFNVTFNGVNISSPVQNLTGIDFRLCETPNSENYVHNVTVPIIFNGKDGSAASAGYSYDRVLLYKRSTSNLVNHGINLNCYYKFANKKLYSDLNLTSEINNLNGWTTNITSDDNGNLYMIAATAYANSEYDKISSSEWSSPIAVLEDGNTPVPPNVDTVFLYLRSNNDNVSAPILTIKYDLSSHKITNYYLNNNNSWLDLTGDFSTTSEDDSYNNGWTISSSGSNGKYLYFTHATAASVTNEDIIEVSEWSTPQIMAVNGDNGSKGDIGKMFYSVGVWNSQTDYKQYYDEYRIPMVFYDDGEWNSALNMNGSYYYVNPLIPTSVNDIYNKIPGISTYTNSVYYWIKASNFGVVMAQGIFSEFAKIGSGLMSGDYLFTSNGTIQGTPYSDGDHYLDDSESPYMRFDSKFPDGKSNDYYIQFLNEFRVGVTVLGGDETIITKPFYMVKGVEYLFRCEQTDETVFDYYDEIEKHRDLAYFLYLVNGQQISWGDVYSNGNTYNYTPTVSGYYIIKGRSVVYYNENNLEVSIDGKILNIILNISNNQPLFVPNWWVDLKTGKMSAAKGNFVVDSNGNVSMNGGKIEFKDNQAKFYGNSGIANIIFGIDNDSGCSVLQFYDNNGQYLYDLGPEGLKLRINTNSGFAEIMKLVKFDNFDRTLDYQNLHQTINNIPNLIVSPVYQYKAGTVSLENGTIITEGSSDDDGKLSSSDINNNDWLDDGWYLSESKQSYLNNGIFIKQYVYIDNSKINKSGYIYYIVQNSLVTLYSDENKTRQYNIPTSGNTSILEIIGERLPRD